MKVDSYAMNGKEESEHEYRTPSVVSRQTNLGSRSLSIAGEGLDCTSHDEGQSPSGLLSYAIAALESKHSRGGADSANRLENLRRRSIGLRWIDKTEIYRGLVLPERRGECHGLSFIKEAAGETQLPKNRVSKNGGLRLKSVVPAIDLLPIVREGTARISEWVVAGGLTGESLIRDVSSGRIIVLRPKENRARFCFKIKIALKEGEIFPLKRFLPYLSDKAICRISASLLGGYKESIVGAGKVVGESDIWFPGLPNLEIRRSQWVWLRIFFSQEDLEAPELIPI